MKFSGVMVGSANPKVLGEFYTKVLGEPGFRQDGWYGWQDGAQFMIGAHSEVKGSNATPQRIMLALEVPDVKAAYEQMLENGAKKVAEPYQPDAANEMLLATVADPDGNYVQLAEPWK